MSFLKAKIGHGSWFNSIIQIFVGSQRDARIESVSDWIDAFKEGSKEYISSPQLIRKQEQLKDNSALTIKLVALSGLGKTRLVYETFKDKNAITPKSFICKKTDDSDIEQKILTFFSEEGKDADMLILDDCPNDRFKKIMDYRNQYNPKCRLIALNNDFFNQTSLVGCNPIIIKVDDVRDDVNQYIDREIPVRNNDTFYREQVKRLADGYPFLAIRLVEAYKECSAVSALDVELLMPGLLKLDIKEDKDELTAMRTLALFQPLGYSEGRAAEFDTVAYSPLITPLNRMDKDEKRSVFNTIIKRYADTFIDKGVDWLNVRPLPLAVWLVKGWLENSNIIDVATYLKSQPSHIATNLINCMSKRMAEMEGNTLAHEMIDELATNPDADFCKEEVVCSDLGSRLFLAFTTVNPVAINSILCRVLNRISVEHLKEGLKGDARRNLVMAFEKLCYVPETAHDAIMMLGKLSLAENEGWANNATGQFGQLFHIMLSGTVASLDERIEIIKELASCEDYQPVTLSAINNALANAHFSRSGGSEYFATKKISDYYPGGEEIYRYWESAIRILLEWCESDSSMIEEASKIALNHIHPYIGRGYIETIRPLINGLIALRDNKWDKLYEELLRIKNIHDDAQPATMQIIDNWLILLQPKLFVYRLKEARTQMYGSYHLSPEEEQAKQIEVYTPIVDRFINDSIYTSINEIDAIIDDNEFWELAFVRLLREKMSDEQSSQLFTTIENVLTDRNDDMNNSFINSVCYGFSGTSAFDKFVEWLLENNKPQTYARIMGASETKDSLHLSRIEDRISKGIISRDYLLTYLRHVNLWSDDQFIELVEHFEDKYPEYVNYLVDFIINHKFVLGHDESKKMIDLAYRLSYKFELKPDNNRENYEFTRFLTDLLETHRNAEAAKRINEKYIQALNTGYYHGNLDGIFDVLLRKYPDETWNDFAEKFISEGYEAFYLHVHNDVGSGSGFGRGPLFEDDERVIAFCKLHPDSAPQRFSSMIPVYAYPEKDSFGKLFMFMLDEYGGDKYVLSGLHANLHTFGWTGSPIPLFKDNIECLKLLLNHKRESVRIWAQNCIDEYEAEIKRETSQEEFMRMHYDK